MHLHLQHLGRLGSIAQQFAAFIPEPEKMWGDHVTDADGVMIWEQETGPGFSWFLTQETKKSQTDFRMRTSYVPDGIDYLAIMAKYGKKRGLAYYTVAVVISTRLSALPAGVYYLRVYPDTGLASLFVHEGATTIETSIPKACHQVDLWEYMTRLARETANRMPPCMSQAPQAIAA